MKLRRNITATAASLIFIFAATSCTAKSEPDAITKDDYCGNLYEAHQNYQANSLVYRTYSSDSRTRDDLHWGVSNFWTGTSDVLEKIQGGTINWADPIDTQYLLLPLLENTVQLLSLLEQKSPRKQEVVAAIRAIDKSYRKAMAVCPTNYLSDAP